jgi:uncharacterized protein YqjF (DUF2071 family)
MRLPSRRVRLPKHPVPMRTMFRRCLLVNFAIDPDAMGRALPPHIEPDLYDGDAYLSVVVAQMERMRPAFAPQAFGVTYNQIVYRVVVRCGDERGVHFLRSDADNSLMAAFGNVFSSFRFHRSAIELAERDGRLELDVHTTSDVPADIYATYTVSDPRRSLPSTSAFPDLATATSWLVELFAAFAYTPGRSDIDVVRIARGAWDVHVVDDLRGHYDFLTSSRGPFPPDTTRLDSVFHVGDVPYVWHRGERIPAPT